MELYMTALKGVLDQSGLVALTGGNLLMLLISFILLYLAIAKDFEPLLLMPIAFGCLIVNLPLSGIIDEGGFLYYIMFGIRHEIYPIIIFMGIGALTDFGPLWIAGLVGVGTAFLTSYFKGPMILAIVIALASTTGMLIAIG